MTITPAILPENFEQLHDSLFRIEGLTHRVQIDLCDGRMGLEKTWLPYKETHLPGGFEYEFDLMVEDWVKFLPRVISLGAKRIILHIDEWEEHDFDMLYEVLLHHSKVSIGLSITNNGSIETLIKRVLELENRHSKLFVQLMGINKIGAQGQPFDERVLAKIENVRRSCRGIPIQIDGSMNPETIFLVKRSGAAGVVIGSYIFGSNNIKKTIDSLHLSFGD
jgi:pentose-5-phosphate-3-epimerase